MFDNREFVCKQNLKTWQQNWKKNAENTREKQKHKFLFID